MEEFCLTNLATVCPCVRMVHDCVMKQLTGLDASFLYMETATTFGHVSGLAVYERPTPEFDPYQAVYDRFGALVGQAEPMRRKLVEVPLSLDHPVLDRRRRVRPRLPRPPHRPGAARVAPTS